jgi:hypothetical protein
MQVSVDIGVGWGKRNIRSKSVMPGLVMGERPVHRRRLALCVNEQRAQNSEKLTEQQLSPVACS